MSSKYAAVSGHRSHHSGSKILSRVNSTHAAFEKLGAFLLKSGCSLLMESFLASKLAVKPTFISPTGFTLIQPLRFTASSSAAAFRVFSASTATVVAPPPILERPAVTFEPQEFGKTGGRARGRGGKESQKAELKENWLDALSCPFPHEKHSPEWVIGVDPDVSGAFALLKPDHSAQVILSSNFFFFLK